MRRKTMTTTVAIEAGKIRRRRSDHISVGQQRHGSISQSLLASEAYATAASTVNHATVDKGDAEQEA